VEYADWAESIFGEDTPAQRSANVAAFDAATEKCHDFEEEFYGNNPLAYQTDLSARGGTSGGTTYFLAGTAKRDVGLAPNDFYNKQSLRVNLAHAARHQRQRQRGHQPVHGVLVDAVVRRPAPPRRRDVPDQPVAARAGHEPVPERGHRQDAAEPLPRHR
jgi:hypothetical protein